MHPQEAKNTWNIRFSSKEYIYGKAPNEFFKTEIDKLSPGRLLLPAEGEGRNAVYAAGLGWDVVAFDSSIEGKKKALNLAKEQGVEIEYQLKSFDEFQAEKNSFDLLVLVYAHHINRQNNHRKLLKYLKPRGIILLEGFTKEQLQNNTGGPPSLQLLFSEEELKEDFQEVSKIEIEQKTKHLTEGKHHIGDAAIIRLKGVR